VLCCIHLAPLHTHLLLAAQDGLYPLLLSFVDSAAVGDQIATMAMELLAVLPTQPALTERLTAALDDPADKQQQLASILQGSSSDSMVLDGEQERQQQQEPAEQQQSCAPYQTLYALQALCALLFPSFDDALLAADAEAPAQGSACPSPAAGAAPGPTQAAAVSAAQQLQRREQQQQEFLQHQGLGVVLAAAQRAAASSAGDLKLQRQLSELLVVLLHNLLDAALGWHVQPAAAVLPANSNGMLSGAESSAGRQPAAPLAVRAGNSCPAALMQVGDGSSMGAAAADSDAATTPAATADTTHHLPPSPMMDVSSPGPGQQQQQPHKQQRQRQRAGDLPPLPPHGQQQGGGAGSGGSHAAASAAVGPSLAALLGEHTLHTMANTLLAVAVDTSRLWGSSDPGAAMPDDDGSKDVVVARDALQVLQRLLEHPPLLQALLLDVSQPPLISTVLLNPHYSPLRRQAAELLERLVQADASRTRLLPWLLNQLNAARPLVQQRPGSCGEFYALLSHSLAQLSSTAQLPESLFSMASDMLDAEVAALKALAAASPASSSSQPPASPSKQQPILQQQQPTPPRRLRRRPQQLPAPLLPGGTAFDDADVAGAGEDERFEPAACSLLQGRLQLVLALVRALDRRAIGSEGQGGLIKLLLQVCGLESAVLCRACAVNHNSAPQRQRSPTAECTARLADAHASTMLLRAPLPPCLAGLSLP
jgi:hypothetical protein